MADLRKEGKKPLFKTQQNSWLPEQAVANTGTGCVCLEVNYLELRVHFPLKAMS